MVDNGLNIVRADADLLAALEAELTERVKPWMVATEAKGVISEQALADYRANLSSLQDRLIFQ